MGKTPSLLVVEHTQIVALHMARLFERQKAKRLLRSKSSVHRTIEKFKKHESNNTKKTGRPLQTSRRDDHAI